MTYSSKFIIYDLLISTLALQEIASVKKSPNIIPESDSDESKDTEDCEKCGKEVSPFEMPEHMDFHYAQELQEISNLTFERERSTPIQGAKNKRPTPLKDSSSEEEESDEGK